MRPHLSINVRDLEKSVAFYSKVFGIAPQKVAPGYAKFDLKSPHLNFSMHEAESGRLPSRVNHFGIEVMTAEAVTTWQEHLNVLCIAIKTEEGTDCCYARQDKVWFEDPDGNAWEVFFVHEQLPVTGAEPPNQKMKVDKGKASACGPGSGCC